MRAMAPTLGESSNSTFRRRGPKPERWRGGTTPRPRPPRAPPADAGHISTEASPGESSPDTRVARGSNLDRGKASSPDCRRRGGLPFPGDRRRRGRTAAPAFRPDPECSQLLAHLSSCSWSHALQLQEGVSINLCWPTVAGIDAHPFGRAKSRDV